jgi:hypothetical protein
MNIGLIEVFKPNRISDLEVGKYHIVKITPDYKLHTECGLELQATDKLIKFIWRYCLSSFILHITKSSRGHVEYIVY